MATSALSRRWVFTLNNSDADEVPNMPHERYVVWQVEQAPTTGTVHIQGYLECAKPVRMSALKKVMATAHFEPARGDQKQCIDYCKKEDTRLRGPWERGEANAGGQGARNDLAHACAIVKEDLGSTEPLQRVAEECPSVFVRYHKGLAALASQLTPDRCEMPEVVVYWGPTGTGKSRSAREFLGEASPALWCPAQGQWFDGYCSQQKFLFEEFRGQLPYGMMLNLLDRYTAKVQVKGGMQKFVATKIAITSPVHPRDWYPNLAADDKIDQLMRRITKIVQLKKNFFQKSTTVKKDLVKLADPIEPISHGDCPICLCGISDGCRCSEAVSTEAGSSSSYQEGGECSSAPHSVAGCSSEDIYLPREEGGDHSRSSSSSAHYSEVSACSNASELWSSYCDR